MAKLDAVIQAQRRYLAATAELEASVIAREDAALAAFERRASVRDLAAALDVTPGRVSQLLQKARNRASASAKRE